MPDDMTTDGSVDGAETAPLRAPETDGLAEHIFGLREDKVDEATADAADETVSSQSPGQVIDDPLGILSKRDEVVADDEDSGDEDGPEAEAAAEAVDEPVAYTPSGRLVAEAALAGLSYDDMTAFGSDEAVRVHLRLRGAQEAQKGTQQDAVQVGSIPEIKPFEVPEADEYDEMPASQRELVVKMNNHWKDQVEGVLKYAASEVQRAEESKAKLHDMVYWRELDRSFSSAGDTWKDVVGVGDSLDVTKEQAAAREAVKESVGRFLTDSIKSGHPVSLDRAVKQALAAQFPERVAEQAVAQTKQKAIATAKRTKTRTPAGTKQEVMSPRESAESQIGELVEQLRAKQGSPA